MLTAAAAAPPLRRALCHLKLQQPEAAAQLALQVLQHAPGHAKALYLLGSARLAQRCTGAAVECLSRALQAAPGDATVAGQLRRAQELARQEQRRRMKAMAAGWVCWAQWRAAVSCTGAAVCFACDALCVAMPC
jgi:cytochrome c-type biogenesis protein CcmH/NrfG